MKQILVRVQDQIQLRGYSLKTEKSYLTWIRRYLYFLKGRDPELCGAPDVVQFLTDLATTRHVAPNTQKVALNALAFLYHKVLNLPLGDLEFTLATKRRTLPSVLRPEEVRLIMAGLQPQNRLIVSLLYGSGLRISECLRLRVQDLDFDRLAIHVIDGKGRKDRQTLLSSALVAPLKREVVNSVKLQREDQRYGVGVSVPYLWQ